MNLLQKIQYALLVVFILSGCGQKNISEVVPPGGGIKEISMEVGSFHFVPNVIIAHHGDQLRLEVENTSEMEHNVTITDPEGTTLHSVDIPAKNTSSIDIVLEKHGTYRLYCDKPVHTSLGMEGRIEAREKE